MQESKAPLPNSRKRPLADGTASIQDSLRYKIRAVVRDLRPHFIEVLKTPEFRNCKAATDIREGMKLLIDLYKELAEQTARLESCSNGDIKPAVQQLDMKPPQAHQMDVKHAEHQVDVKPAENAPGHLPSQNGVPSNASNNNAQVTTYIVGGSAFGWNFITFNSTNHVYYGRTKEDYRVTNPKSE